MHSGVLVNNSHINNGATMDNRAPLMTNPNMNTPVMTNPGIQVPGIAPVMNTRQRSRSRSSSDERRRVQRNNVAPLNSVPVTNFNNGVGYNDGVMINNTAPGYI